MSAISRPGPSSGDTVCGRLSPLPKKSKPLTARAGLLADDAPKGAGPAPSQAICPMADAQALTSITVMAVAPDFHRLPFSPGRKPPGTLAAYEIVLQLSLTASLCGRGTCVPRHGYPLRFACRPYGLPGGKSARQPFFLRLRYAFEKIVPRAGKAGTADL